MSEHIQKITTDVNGKSLTATNGLKITGDSRAIVFQIQNLDARSLTIVRDIINAPQNENALEVVLSLLFDKGISFKDARDWFLANYVCFIRKKYHTNAEAYQFLDCSRSTFERYLYEFKWLTE